MITKDSVASELFMMDRDSVLERFRAKRTDREWNVAAAAAYLERDARKKGRPYQHATRNIYLIDWPEMPHSRDATDFPEFDSFDDYVSYKLTYL